MKTHKVEKTFHVFLRRTYSIYLREREREGRESKDIMRVLDKKIKRLLEMRTDSPEMLRALGSLSSFYGSKGNTLEARRSLRADLEQRNIELVKDFIESFSSTATKLIKLDETVKRVNKTCIEMQKKLETSEKKTRAFTEVTISLRKRREEKIEREKLMRSFLDQFELSDRQIETLYSVPVYQGGGKDFFEALDVVRKIRKDCQRLLTTQYQKVGQGVLESISLHENKALERLFEWTKTRMYASFTSSKPIVDPYLERAVKTLCSIRSYRKLCTDLLAQTRMQAVEIMFDRALKIGGNNVHPIEMHAHEPERYAGDMLAWVRTLERLQSLIHQIT